MLGTEGGLPITRMPLVEVEGKRGLMRQRLHELYATLLFKLLLKLGHKVFGRVLIGLHQSDPEKLGWVLFAYPDALPETVTESGELRPEPPISDGDGVL